MIHPIQVLGETEVLHEIGGKAHGLGKLIQAGFKVPSGFVITAQNFMAMSRELEGAILRYFDELESMFVAVRSSAVAEDGSKDAWAGQFSTYLNTTRDNLLENIINCWESAGSERAKSYALQKSVASGAIAVVVQEMVAGDVSGVAFSTHPVTGDHNMIVIEACLGLGEPVVSGTLTPDSYIISKDLTVIERRVVNQRKKLVRGKTKALSWRKVSPSDGEKQKLSDQQIIDIAEMVKRIENHFENPVDIEWTIKADQLYLLQCRPITTLPSN